MRMMSDRAPAATSTVCSGATPIRPVTGCGATIYVPGRRGTKNVPSTPDETLPVSAPEPSRTTSTAPAMTRGAQEGSGGTFSTGQVGPAVTVPAIPPEAVGEAPGAWAAHPAVTRRRNAVATAVHGSFVRVVMA